MKIPHIKFFNAGNTTIAVSSFAGRTVKATAKLDPRDSFNPEMGKAIAGARCRVKIADKRVTRAEQKVIEATQAVNEAYAKYSKAYDYYENALKERADASDAYNATMKEV